MFHLVFDSALFELTQPTPAFAPLFKLPPTRTEKKTGEAVVLPTGTRGCRFFLPLVNPF